MGLTQADSGTAFAGHTTESRGDLFRRRAVAAGVLIYSARTPLRHGIAVAGPIRTPEPKGQGIAPKDSRD